MAKNMPNTSDANLSLADRINANVRRMTVNSESMQDLPRQLIQSQIQNLPKQHRNPLTHLNSTDKFKMNHQSINELPSHNRNIPYQSNLNKSSLSNFNTIDWHQNRG